MLNTMALCMSRSRMAAATTASPKISPQSGRPRLVRDDGGVALLVAGVDDVEEHRGAVGAADGQQPDVVDDEHGGRGVGLQLRRRGCLRSGRATRVRGHVVGGGEVAAVAGLDGDGGERDGEVGLAAAGLAEEQDRAGSRR